MIATGLGGATGTRLLEQLRQESVMTAFTRIAGRSPDQPHDPTSGEQTRINDRGPESAEEVELFVDKLLYLAQGVDLRSRRQRAAGCPRTCTRA